MSYAVLAGAIVVAAALAGVIAAGARRKGRRNGHFLDGALVTRTLAPGAPTEVAFRTAAAPHAVWIDLELTGVPRLAFELALSIRVGAAAVLEGSYRVTFDDEEHDARGLPNPPGLSALNTSAVIAPGSWRIATVLRAYRFDAPAAPASATVRATLSPAPGVIVAHAALVITSPDAPPGSGALPAGMRATS
ncbi:MAG: hypothetical protein KF773_39650 [Deltaproteobacteria bacterium]|nr:hypothetical protein [Deltaproteobacteria bacterium]